MVNKDVLLRRTNIKKNTLLKATASYSNEGLVASKISPCAADRGRVSAIAVERVCLIVKFRLSNCLVNPTESPSKYIRF